MKIHPSTNLHTFVDVIGHIIEKDNVKDTKTKGKNE